MFSDTIKAIEPESQNSETKIITHSILFFLKNKRKLCLTDPGINLQELNRWVEMKVHYDFDNLQKLVEKFQHLSLTLWMKASIEFRCSKHSHFRLKCRIVIRPIDRKPSTNEKKVQNAYTFSNWRWKQNIETNRRSRRAIMNHLPKQAFIGSKSNRTLFWPSPISLKYRAASSYKKEWKDAALIRIHLISRSNMIYTINAK